MIKSINEATIILGPEGVFNSKEQNKPITTDNIPPMIEKNCYPCLNRMIDKSIT